MRFLQFLTESGTSLAEHFDLLVLSLGPGFLARGGLASRMITYRVLCLLTRRLFWVRESRTLLGDGICELEFLFLGGSFRVPCYCEESFSSCLSVEISSSLSFYSSSSGSSHQFLLGGGGGGARRCSSLQLGAGFCGTGSRYRRAAPPGWPFTGPPG